MVSAGSVRRPAARWLSAAVALTALLGLLPGQCTSAAADPSDPGARAVARAKAETKQRAAEVTRIESRLASARIELDQAGTAAEQAVEAYNGAEVRLGLARERVAVTAQRAAVAAAAREAAAADAGRLAAEGYRLGGSPELAALDSLLSADGLAGLADRAEVVKRISTRSRHILDQAVTTARAAEGAAGQARDAETQAFSAAESVRAAKERAEDRLQAQRVELGRIRHRRGQLLARLAAARRTTVALERRRQQALAAAAARKAAAAARAAAAALPGRGGGVWDAGGAAAAVAFARGLIGHPYVWGGAGPGGYDCSGLTMMAWRRGGRALPHFAASQYARSTPLTYNRLRPGDLLFWTGNGRPDRIYHVGLYVGHDQMIEAPRPGAAVKQASIWIMGTPDFYGRP